MSMACQTVFFLFQEDVLIYNHFLGSDALVIFLISYITESMDGFTHALVWCLAPVNCKGVLYRKCFDIAAVPDLIR